MKPLKLFHISEKGDIDVFIPRKSKQIWDYKEYVWAISESLIHNYLFPRDCPRICVGQKQINLLTEWIDKKDIEDTRAFVFIAEHWEERYRSCRLYQYEFSPENFKIIDAIAGYYVSESTEKPTRVQVLNNCDEVLESMKVEVLIKTQQELSAIKEKLIQTTNNFSIIKWSNLK